jgi:septum formation protein
MLETLSGRTHHVTTGYAVIRVAPRAVRVGHATARVTMGTLAPADIDALLASGEADDKAGAYAIQGAAGRFVERLEGARDTVIGLPVEDVLHALRDLGFHPGPGSAGASMNPR